MLQSVVAGLAAAAVAALVIAGVGLAFPAAVVAAPIAFVGTAILAAGIDITLSLTVNESIKKYINLLLDSYYE